MNKEMARVIKETRAIEATFYGNEISEYGRKHGYVDYACFASAFDSVLCGHEIFKASDAWENVNFGKYDELTEALTEEQSEAVDRAEACEAKAEAEENSACGRHDFFIKSAWAYWEDARDTQSEIEAIEEESEPDVCQWFIVSESGARLIERYTKDPLYYSEELDLYVWGVTHYGTSWTYVLTDIPCYEK